jgi:hypothetical protein
MLSDLADELSGSIRRIVVGKDDLPAKSNETALEALHELKYVRPFVEGWDNHRQLRALEREIFFSCSDRLA